MVKSCLNYSGIHGYIFLSLNPILYALIFHRGSLFRQTKRFTAAVDDCLLAMDKCGHKQDSQVYCDASRQLVLTYNDFAIECFKRKKFEYAIKLLNRAIKDEREEKGLYLNRGGMEIVHAIRQ